MQNTRGQVAARLRGAGLTCNVLNEDDFRASMFEKHMWICAFMLLGVHHGGTVGDVAAQHRSAPCSPASPLPCVCVYVLSQLSLVPDFSRDFFYCRDFCMGAVFLVIMLSTFEQNKNYHFPDLRSLASKLLKGSMRVIDASR